MRQGTAWYRRRSHRVTALALLLSACQTELPPERPNVILIVADDLGWGELGSYGQTRIRTPVLDRLAVHLGKGLDLCGFVLYGTVKGLR